MEHPSPPKPLSPFLGGILGALFVFLLLVGAVYAFPQGAQTFFSQILYTKPGTTTLLPPTTVEEVVEQVNPSVVSIIITKDVPILERYYQEQRINPFSPFFFSVPQYLERGTEKKEVGGGSGFLISSDGYLVTNYHVVNQEDAEYTVFTNDEKTYDAKVVAGDPKLDIAVLKIEAKDLPFLEFGDSSQLRLGQPVIAIGNALAEFRNTVSVGVISGLARSITAGDTSGRVEQLASVIQTDAAINPGNSGGPLIDLNGRVIGVNVAVAQGSENIGFALPANEIKNVVESIRSHGRVIRPYLGVRFLPVTKELQETNALPVDYGVWVQKGEEGEVAVLSGSPADKAGIKENDIILEIDGQKLHEGNTLPFFVNTKQVGDQVKLKIHRDGKEREVLVTLEERPENI